MPFDPASAVEETPTKAAFDPASAREFDPASAVAVEEPRLSPSAEAARARLGATKAFASMDTSAAFAPLPGVERAVDLATKYSVSGAMAQGTPLEGIIEAEKGIAKSIASPGGAALAALSIADPALGAGLGAAASLPAVGEGWSKIQAGASKRDWRMVAEGLTEAGAGVTGVVLGGLGLAGRLAPRTAAELARPEPAPPVIERPAEAATPKATEPSPTTESPVTEPQTAPAPTAATEGRAPEAGAKPVAEPATGTGTVPSTPATTEATPTAAPTEPPPKATATVNPAAPAATPSDAALSSTDPPRFVGIKNARVDAQRAERGLPPLMEPTRKADAALWDAAMARVEADPALPDRLVRELTEIPRPMTDEETVIVERRLMELTNDLDQARWEGIKAADAGDAAKAAEMDAKAGELSDALTVVEQAVGRENEAGVGAGTLMGRALRSRQLLMQEDFSYGGLERAKRSANKFEPLTDAQKNDIEATSKAFKAIQDRLQKRIAAYNERIAKGDFTPRKRASLPDDPEINRLSFELEKLKKRWYEGLIEDKMRQRPPLRKVAGGFAESLNAMRAILTSTDLSALLRQGKFMVLSHPVRAARAVPAMIKAFGSEQAAFEVNRAIEQSPNYRLMRASKLFLAEHGVQLSKMEEQYMSRWASKIPGVGHVVRGSERSYTTFLNKLRADSFDAMAETLGRDGKVTPEQGRIIANFINVATGRGTIGMADQAAVGLNTIFFAPRFVASRFQMLLGQPLYYGLLGGKVPFAGKGAAAARALVAREYGRILAGAATVYTLGKLAGASIETDPRSSDFGKMRWGNTRIDPLAGLNQITVLLSRVASGETKQLKTGHIRPLRPTEGKRQRFGSETTADVIFRFGRLKLAPAPGLALDIATGTDAIGKRVTAGSLAANAVVPISIQDIVTQMQNEGYPQNMIFSVLSIFGETVQNFDETQRNR